VDIVAKMVADTALMGSTLRHNNSIKKNKNMNSATSLELSKFQSAIIAGIPSDLPEIKNYDAHINHAPKRKNILNDEEKKLALKNALRYFPKDWHQKLLFEFDEELKLFGRIYMYRFRPDYEMYARPIEHYPAKSSQAAAIMLMIQNNLDPAVAQHPHELITYGGNGSVFQNWAQYLLTMQYLSEMSDEQTLVMYSGHPMGLFPSHKDAPRVVITNGLTIPNYSKPDDWERFNALGVSQYGQMTAGSYMYIGPQGIVHGTTITLMNAARMKTKINDNKTLLFVSAGLGGMSGAQPKAAKIAGIVSITAEVNTKAAEKRHQQGWVDMIVDKADLAIDLAIKAQSNGDATSIAFCGNIVELWEKINERGIKVDLGSDQTSLHNPFSGGYYPVGLSFDIANKMMADEPEEFKSEVYKSLIRHANAINLQANQGMYFFDYGNAFLLEADRAGADVKNTGKDSLMEGREFKYPSYVQDILGPICFDYGFGPFRWVCCSGLDEDLELSDKIAGNILEEMLKDATDDIRSQIEDNLHWIRNAQKHKLVVGSKARILYADAEGRMRIGRAFNEAIATGKIKGSIVLGRDHHDVSGTDSPFRETSNIYDGSRFTADMAVQNFVGDAFRGATWVSLHNGGGVGWGEVINGGFGLLLDGSHDSERRLKSMLHWDVNNGIARRAWARNKEAVTAIERAMKSEPLLKVTLPNEVDEKLFE